MTYKEILDESRLGIMDWLFDDVFDRIMFFLEKLFYSNEAAQKKWQK